MATASVSGLVSGLDTATIISQLMQVEAQPQTMLKTRLSTAQSNLSTLQSLNAKFAALTTKAHDLAQPVAWSPAKATSSSDKVTVTAGSTAIPTSLSLTVDRVATSSRTTFEKLAGTAGVTSGPVVLSKGGTDYPVDAGSGSLDELVAGINRAGAGVTATKVALGNGEYRVSVASADTGTGSAFTLSNISAATTQTAGQNAQITVAGDAIESQSNTFTGLLQGVDVTLAPSTPAGTPVDISIARDAAAAQGSLQSLVDAANEILTQIDKLTAYDATAKSSGPLAGDPSVRDLRSQVLNAVTRSADGTSLAEVGVQTDRYGKIVFDATKFASAYAADPAKVASKLGSASTGQVPGFAARLESVGKSASDSVNGVLTQSIQGRQSSVTTMQDSIADWDVRLATRQDALKKQFSALEVSLSKMQNQASWLSGQIAQLPSSSS
jgi:flagellar hook-associated protein 2